MSAGAQSADGKAAYVMLNLAGEQGQTLANEGVEAVRKVIEETKAPPGVEAYVAGPAALTNDMHVIGTASLGKITLYTRSEEHTSELQSLMRTSSAVFCLKK